ncbi:hypothetical protein [Paenibacillus sp. N3.4]|uniref:hypothetical protein n=1 Tax=Paenibacillus sp. N3.4 TaxID=2603222 RepID=UPI001C9C3312|nr:hypothetical protein [Paenibacillus sp. N3.4]
MNLLIVSFDRRSAENIPIVTYDNVMGGILAERLFIEKGCRKSAFLYAEFGGTHLLQGDY